MGSKVLIQKIVFFIIFYPVLYIPPILIMAPSIFTDWIYILTFGIFFLTGMFDTLARPASSEKEESKIYGFLILLLLLTGPIRVLLLYWENQLLIAVLVPVWDSLPISFLGVGMLILAGLITVVGRYQLGEYGSGRLVIKNSHQLITEGIYRYIRNPIYLGGLLGITAFGLVFRGLIVLILSSLFYMLIIRHRIDYEEQILQSKFGTQYLEYKKHTKRLIPFIY